MQLSQQLLQETDNILHKYDDESLSELVMLALRYFDLL